MQHIIITFVGGKQQYLHENEVHTTLTSILAYRGSVRECARAVVTWLREYAPEGVEAVDITKELL